MEEQIINIINEMAEHLNVSQLKRLQSTLVKHLGKAKTDNHSIKNLDYLQLFINAKRIEGCTNRTIQYYESTISKMLSSTNTPVRRITTEEIRDYLVSYQQINSCSKTIIDNVRRNISGLFFWLKEDYILKSPTHCIHKIKLKSM